MKNVIRNKEKRIENSWYIKTKGKNSFKTNRDAAYSQFPKTNSANVNKEIRPKRCIAPSNTTRNSFDHHSLKTITKYYVLKLSNNPEMILKVQAVNKNRAKKLFSSFFKRANR